MDGDSLQQERRRRQGRPRTVDRAARENDLLAAAMRVFLEHGFAGASFDAIARAAGISTKTIYSLYGSKAGLFARAMQRFAGTLLPPLEDAMRQAGKPEEALFAFAFGIGTTLLSPDAVRLQRVVIAEVNGGNGGFAAAMYEFGSRQGAQSLAAYLASQVQGGAFAIEDTGLAAEQFLGAALAEPWRRAIFGVEPACDAAELERRVRQAVSGFMRQYQGNDVPPVSGTPPQSTR